MVLTILLLGWSVSQPMPQHFAPPAPAAADQESYSTTTAVTAAIQKADSGEDFIDPQRWKSSARTPATERPSVAERPAGNSLPQSTPIVPGRAVRLDPISALSVPLSGRIEFVATLINIQMSDWRVIGELYVAKGDGTTEKLFGPRSIRLGRAQTLRLPVGFAATPKRFPPGPTQFIAILRDQAGEIIDQATITFSIELGH